MFLFFLSALALAAPKKKDSQDKSDSSSAEGNMYYKGFGGVGLGYQRYTNFAVPPGSERLLEGRNGFEKEKFSGTTVTSFYYSRIKESPIYLGYAVSAMFSNRSVVDRNTDSLMFPECPSYLAPYEEEDFTYEGVSSVNGEEPGWKNETFQHTEGTYVEDGQTYQFSCQNLSGVRNNQESLVHIPAEVNIAYVLRPMEKVQLWAAAGISINWYDYKYMFSQNGLTAVYDEYVSAELVDYTWGYEYTENFGASKALEDSGIKGVLKAYLPGAQVSIGSEYVIGKLPKIGGDWGVGIIGKYSYVKGLKQDITPGFEYYFEGHFENDPEDEKQRVDFSQSAAKTVSPRLSNWNISGSLTWHY